MSDLCRASTTWRTTRSRPFISAIYLGRISQSLNNFENHRTVQTYEDRLIIKLFVFFFIDCFLCAVVVLLLLRCPRLHCIVIDSSIHAPIHSLIHSAIHSAINR